MKLWTQWLQAVRLLRPACHRARTLVWMALVLMGLCCRSDNAGCARLDCNNAAGRFCGDRMHYWPTKGGKQTCVAG